VGLEDAQNQPDDQYEQQDLKQPIAPPITPSAQGDYTKQKKN